jgi:multidrug transporter EmrE-like cation transporter
MLGVVCFGEQLNLRAAVGIVIVLLAVTLVVCADGKKKSAPEPAN